MSYPTPFPSRFTDERERTIYDRLRLIGDGPSANFIDACIIMASDEGVRLQSATHIVGHLLREIESAVRDVLLAFARHGDLKETQVSTGDPSGAATNTVNGVENHKQEILMILRHYQIEEMSGVGQLWLALAGAAKRTPSYVRPLHAFAHRNALARPRPLDGEFRLFWDDVLGLLQTLLVLFESYYVTAIDIVDDLLTHEQPTRDDAKRLREAVPNSRVVLGYFFDHCQNPLWIGMLAAKDFFAHPPGVELDDETGAVLGYPVWPASRYLARMARHPKAHAEVARVVRKLMNADNPRVREDIVEILTHLPVERIADLTVEIATWIDREEK